MSAQCWWPVRLYIQAARASVTMPIPRRLVSCWARSADVRCRPRAPWQFRVGRAERRLPGWNAYTYHHGATVYEYDKQAWQVAAAHPASNTDAALLRQQCARTIACLGDEGIRSHAVNYSVAAWQEPPGLPDSVPQTGRITRGDVKDIRSKR
jgi:hypothetical protein